MVRVVVAARTNRVSRALPVIVSDYLIGYLLSGDGRQATMPPDFVSVKDLSVNWETTMLCNASILRRAG